MIDNVVGVTIVAEESDGQCIWSDHCVRKGKKVVTIVKDYLICISQSMQQYNHDFKILQPRVN